MPPYRTITNRAETMTVMRVPLLFSLLTLVAITAQDSFFVAQDATDTVNLSELADSLFAEIGNATGTNALQKGPLTQDTEDGFKCALVVVKGNEPFHTHDNADLFGSIIHGGGYLNVGNGTSVALQVGDNIFIQAGQTHQLFNMANDYTAIIACFYPNDSAGEFPVNDNPGPELPYVASGSRDAEYYGALKTMDGAVTNLLALEHPAENETRAVYPNTRTEKMSVATVVLATCETYHVHQDSALFIVVVEGTVETSSATDENVKISVPQGSFMLLDKCAPHKFGNLESRDSPAILLAAFGPALTTGDSPAVKDAECLTVASTTTSSPTKITNTAGMVATLVLSTGLVFVYHRKFAACMRRILLAFYQFFGRLLF